MPKFTIGVILEFTGTVDVDARTQEQAEEIVQNNFWTTIGECGSENDQIKDWNINVHGKTWI